VSELARGLGLTRSTALEFALHVGSRIPAYCSATGKALLAFMPRPDLGQLLDRIDLIQRGPRTVTSKTASPGPGVVSLGLAEPGADGLIRRVSFPDAALSGCGAGYGPG
jgi:Bacterial transcriptional regulator